MTKAIEIILKPRTGIIETVKQLSLEQLNYVPAGFNNNIIWNLGHIVAAQQGICYKRAGLEAVIDDDFFNRYKAGTKPETPADAAEFENIISLLSSTILRLQEDVAAGFFVNYQSWTTRYGVELNSINDALAFLPFHEGLHLAAIAAIKKFI